MSDDLIGQSLGQYQIRVLLGRGGMSSVYLAFQPSMERTVAIKVLPREFMHDKTFLTRFQQEARTIAKLEHLHILPVYDVGEDKGIPYLVMRYLPGGTFADMIAEKLPPIAATVRLLGQIADALDYAHERGIIHRDLKPSNILLDNSNNAYLADFGIARVAEGVGVTGSRVMGTPPYIAPEMVRKDEKLTASVDIYALGIITFEALTGRPPFYDEDPMKTLMMHVLEPVPSARRIDPNIKPEMDEVLMKCLAKTPHERYRTAGEFAAALARAAAPSRDGRGRTPVASTARPEEKTPVAVQPPRSGEWLAPGGAGRGGLIAFGVTLAILGGGLLTGFALTGGNPARLFGAPDSRPTATHTPTVTVTPRGNPGVSGPTLTPRATSFLPPPGGGARLAFASERDGNLELYLMNLDGSDLRRITHNIAPDFDPAWSPDGRKIAYASSTDGDPEIKVLDLASCINQVGSCDSTARQITNNTATDWNPAWSPDGQWIAFSSNRDGHFDIYMMRPDGSDVRRLTTGDADAFSPRWSPDGTQIAFHVQEGNSSDLYIVSAAGGAPRQITSGAGLDLWPDWSPDGTKLVYTSTKADPGGKRALFTIDLNTGSLARLTGGDSNHDDPAWSPDGTRIAYDSDQAGDGHFDLYVLELATGEITRLTDTPQNNVGPAWQPAQNEP